MVLHGVFVMFEYMATMSFNCIGNGDEFFALLKLQNDYVN